LILSYLNFFFALLFLGRKEKMDRLKEKVKTMDCGDIFTAGFLGIIWAPLMIHGIYETCRGL